MDLLWVEWPKAALFEKNQINRKGLGGYFIFDKNSEKPNYAPVENWKTVQDKTEEIDKIYGPNPSTKEKQDVKIDTPKESLVGVKRPNIELKEPEIKKFKKFFFETN